MSDPLVDIAIEAMDYIGRSTIRSFTDNTTEAAVCRRAIGRAIETTLEAADWNWARSFRHATPATAELPSSWAYAYLMPSDAIRIRRIGRVKKAKPITFDIGTDYATRQLCVFTNEASAILVFTLRDPDMTRAPGSFITAAAWNLAGRVVGALRKGEPKWQEKCENSYRVALSHASTNDANETTPDDSDEDMPDHLAARGYQP